MADVFISYARSTASQAQTVARGLEGLGYEVWIDDALPTHRAFSDVIEEQLHAAAAVVVIWSPDAAKSEWVRSEANRGRSEQKLVQVAVEKTRLPLPFDQIHCADLTAWAGEADHLGWKAMTASVAQLVNGRGGPRREVGKAGIRARGAEPRGERRHLTVLTCGLADARKLAASLDPEEWQALVADFVRTAGNAIKGFGGYVATSGEPLTAYFGYPVAQEYAAERAVRAALAVIEAMPQLRAKAAVDPRVELAAGVGVHAGTVVISMSAGGEPEVFGEVLVVASEIQKLASANSVVVTADVHDLVSGQFIVADLGEAASDGNVLHLFQPISPAVASRHGRGFSPRTPTAFVGREDEVRVITGRWERACEGEGQLVLIVGEPGIGKSRLVEEFRTRIRGAPHLWVECGAGPLYANTMFHPVADMLSQALGWGGDETPATRLATLEQSLARASLNPADTAPLVAEMLDLPADSYTPLALPPEERRRRLLAVLAQWTLGAAHSQPLVLIMEDMHWMDPSTMELIRILAEQVATAKLLLICTARPEFQPSWPPRAHHAPITLNRLNARQTRELVAGVAAGLPESLLHAVIERTDGVPLFAEELTRLMQLGGGRLEARDIPATLLDSLGARLDQLGGAKDVAQLGSVLGREFSYGLIRAISPLAEIDLKSGLERLVDAELVYVRGAPPDATYLFKHALVLDAAYATLLKSRRRELHARAALAITDDFPAMAESRPEVLARHWEGAGEAQKAILAWTAAGRRAASRAAHVEAVKQFRAALELVEELPDRPERANLELPLLLGLAVSLSASHGYTSPDVFDALGRARQICDSLGNVAGLFAVLVGICNFYSVAGDLDAAKDAALKCEKIGEETELPAQRIQAAFLVGYCHYSEGRLREARIALERTLQLYAQHDGASLTFYSPTNPRVEALSALSIVLYALDEAEAAARRADELLTDARTLGRPFELAYALAFRWVYDAFAGDYAAAMKHATEGLAICEANGYANFRAVAQITRGISLAMNGEVDAGLEFYRAGLEEMKRLGILRALGLFMGEAARALVKAGRHNEAASIIDEAIERANRSFRVVLPRLHALKAEIIAEAPGSDAIQAKKALHTSLSLARAQGGSRFVKEAKAALDQL